MADDLNFDTTSAQVLALLERVVYMPTSLSLDLALALLVVVLPVVVLIGLPFLDTVLTPNERRNSARAPAIGDATEHVGEPGLGADAVQLGGLDGGVSPTTRLIGSTDSYPGDTLQMQRS